MASTRREVVLLAAAAGAAVAGLAALWFSQTRRRSQPVCVCVFGLGFTGTRFARAALAKGWKVRGTVRSADKVAALAAEGIEAFVLDGEPGPGFAARMEGVTHVLLSAAPLDEGDPFWTTAAVRAVLTGSTTIQWVGYLSTTGVYGNHDGGVVNEESSLNAGLARGKRRILAERQWMDSGLPAHVFRLPGIYGPGRGPLARLKSGNMRRMVIKPGHRFSRIHVDDIVQALMASIARPSPGQTYNVSDDQPEESFRVTTFAAALLGIDPPASVRHEDAELSPMAASFYQESRYVDNTKLKEVECQVLGVRLLYPTYKQGLTAQLQQENDEAAAAPTR